MTSVLGLLHPESRTASLFTQTTRAGWPLTYLHGKLRRSFKPSTMSMFTKLPGLYELVVMSTIPPSVSVAAADSIARYSLPEHVREHIDFISPGIKLSAALKRKEIKRDASTSRHLRPGPIKMIPHSNARLTLPSGAASLPRELQDCGRNVTPVCLKALYQIPDATIKDNVNQLGIFESADKYAQEDLNSFFAEYASNVPQGTHPLLDSIDGGEAPVAADAEDNTGESDIDMDIGFSLIHVS